MSVFSNMLKNYIHEKDIKVGALAHYCNLERSTIYKFINGKREPASEQLVEQISCFIQLTPAETNRLKESWKMARMGEDTYYIHKSIEHFLCDFPNVSPASHTLAPPPIFRRLFSKGAELSALKFQTGRGFFGAPDYPV